MQFGSLSLIHILRISKEIDGEIKTKKVETSVGRIIFNQGIPQDLGFIDRKDCLLYTS